MVDDHSSTAILHQVRWVNYPAVQTLYTTATDTGVSRDEKLNAILQDLLIASCSNPTQAQ